MTIAGAVVMMAVSIADEMQPVGTAQVPGVGTGSVAEATNIVIDRPFEWTTTRRPRNTQVTCTR